MAPNREWTPEFSQLWRELHFSHLATNDAAMDSMRVAFRFGLQPYVDLLKDLIAARRARKDALTFVAEHVNDESRPCRLRLRPRACEASINLPRQRIHVIRIWPAGAPTEGGATLYDEATDTYVKLTRIALRPDGAAVVESSQTLRDGHDYLFKGMTIRVEAEYSDQMPGTITCEGREFRISPAASGGDGNRIIIHAAKADLDGQRLTCGGHAVQLEGLSDWRPAAAVDVHDGPDVLIRNWRGQKSVSAAGLPKNTSLFTADGAEVLWESAQDEGTWVRLRASASADATIDPVDVFFDDMELDTLEGSDKRQYRILARRRDLRMVLLDDDPAGVQLSVWVRDDDIRNQHRALSRLQQAPLEHHLPLMELTRRVDTGSDRVWPRTQSKTPNAAWYTRIGGNSDGSYEQRQFVGKALGTPDFAFLEGPPGSGKTETIGELILQLLSDPTRCAKILLCGSTQASIDNVLARFGDHELVQPLRVVNSKRWRAGDQDPHQIVYDEKVHQWVEPAQVDSLRAALGAAAAGYTDDDLAVMVRRRANLVCATIDGVAQMAEFQQVFRDPMAPPPAVFDVLIIDEASKTTFTQFLVPAIFCRRWILVGDVAQLPPFADSRDIADLLNMLAADRGGLAGGPHRTACLRIHQAIIDRCFDRVPPPWLRQRNLPVTIPRLVVEDARVVEAMATEWRARCERGDEDLGDESLRSMRCAFVGPNRDPAVGASAVVIDSATIDGNDAASVGRLRLALADCDVIVVDRALVAGVDPEWLPATHIPSYMLGSDVGSDELDDSEVRRLNAALRRRFELYRRFYASEAGEFDVKRNRDDPLRQQRGLVAWATTWGDEISWRVQRVYEMQSSRNRELSQRYMQEAQSLLPAAGNRHWATEAERIRCMLLPSILESLQCGFTGRSGTLNVASELAPRIPTTLSEGFPSAAKVGRFEAIPYQHRMHWDISRFPREQFYRALPGNAASTGARLLDAAATLGGRPAFEFTIQKPHTPRQGERRVMWVDVAHGGADKNGNQAEAKVARQIVADLIAWLVQCGGRDRVEVALITPYVNQSQLLRENINGLLAQHGGALRGSRGSASVAEGKHLHVFCSTIDKFQGQEADVVILSLRNVNRQGNIDSPNRANVALTRAREALFIVGHHETYANARDDMLKELAKGTPLGVRGRDWMASS